MRKLYFLLLFIVLQVAAFSQDDSLEALRNYSYLIKGKEGSGLQATGFFARYQSRLFFITAAHCLSGWDPFRFRPVSNFPDTVYIRLSNDTSKLRYLPVPVASIKQHTRPFREYETPDVYILEIKHPKNYDVYSVEKFFDGYSLCENAEQAFLWGFPKAMMDNSYGNERQQAFASMSPLNNAYCLYAFRPEIKRPDPLNYFIQVDAAVAGTGLSGAPTFLLTRDGNIVFGGVFIGGTANGLRSGMVLRPEYVIEKIMTEIARN
jgi:hypothetical protein